MNGNGFRVCVLTTLCALLAWAGTQAQDAKTKGDSKAPEAKAKDEAKAPAAPKNEKAEEFKGKTFDLAEKGKGAVTLTFPGGQEATVTAKGEKEGVHLFVLAGTGTGDAIAKDEGKGPDCTVRFTPESAVTLTVEVRNIGTGANKATVSVSFGKK